MLYETTRSKVDVHTAQRALKEKRAPDGGLYIPAQIPAFSREELSALLKQPSGGIIAEVLNRFFNTKLSQWDVEFAIGRQPFGLKTMSHRIVFGELWRNPRGGFGYTVSLLTDLISTEVGVAEPGLWMQSAARIALVFAMVAQLRAERTLKIGETLDVAVATGDMVSGFSVWYARKMGLPIGTIVFCCNDNSGVWDLICRGQMKLNARVISTDTPECDTAVPEGLELLIYTLLGQEESEQFLKTMEKGGTYFLSSEQHRHFRQGLDACVVSSRRLVGVMPNLYKTNGYVLCPYSALVYAGLMDYRSITRRHNTALIFSEKSPTAHLELISRRLGVGADVLRREIEGG